MEIKTLEGVACLSEREIKTVEGVAHFRGRPREKGNKEVKHCKRGYREQDRYLIC